MFVSCGWRKSRICGIWGIVFALPKELPECVISLLFCVQSCVGVAGLRDLDVCTCFDLYASLEVTYKLLLNLGSESDCYHKIIIGKY